MLQASLEAKKAKEGRRAEERGSPLTTQHIEGHRSSFDTSRRTPAGEQQRHPRGSQAGGLSRRQARVLAGAARPTQSLVDNSTLQKRPPTAPVKHEEDAGPHRLIPLHESSLGWNGNDHAQVVKRRWWQVAEDTLHAESSLVEAAYRHRPLGPDSRSQEITPLRITGPNPGTKGLSHLLGRQHPLAPLPNDNRHDHCYMRRCACIMWTKGVPSSQRLKS